MSSIVTGLFKPFIIYFTIIFIHELGHFLTGLSLGWNLDKIYFYPFGGYSKFNTEINKPLKEELLVLIAGPITQIAFYLLITSFIKVDYIFTSYHYGLLIFNLLPIYPLDGGKLVNILLSFKFSYLKSYSLVIRISLVILMGLFILSLKYYYNFNFILIAIFLLSKIFEYYKEKRHSYNKFLLERYLKNFNFKKYKIVDNLQNIYRDRRHIIHNQTEKTVLKKHFKKY